METSNERLEFLGDAVLSLILADYLYIKYPDEDEGFLSKLRAKAVNREFVNSLGYKLGIDDFMLMEAPFGHDTELPHALVGNALEALFGAIFKDKGYLAAKRFFEKMVLPYHLDVEQLSKEDLDYKSRLLEWGQKTGKKIEFVHSGTEREGNNLIFSIEVKIDGEPYGNAQMPKKKKAEQETARLALEMVEGKQL